MTNKEKSDKNQKPTKDQPSPSSTTTTPTKTPEQRKPSVVEINSADLETVKNDNEDVAVVVDDDDDVDDNNTPSSLDEDKVKPYSKNNTLT